MGAGRSVCLVIDVLHVVDRCAYAQVLYQTDIRCPLFPIRQEVRSRFSDGILQAAVLQNSGGTCATFSGPINTTPSTNRNGNARAFLPSSTASLPSELIPAAT